MTPQPLMVDYPIRLRWMASLSATVGFPFDSTMAVARMIYDGFFDRYPNFKLIVAHGGGTLPVLAGRLDRMWEVISACREHIAKPPSEYLKRIYADSVFYTSNALRDTLECFGNEHVMYGTDFPHGNCGYGGVVGADRVAAGGGARWGERAEREAAMSHVVVGCIACTRPRP